MSVEDSISDDSLAYAFSWLGWLRRQRGFSQDALSLLSGVSQSEIQRIEKNEQECRLSSFVRICTALDVPPGWVLDLALRDEAARFHHAIKDDAGFGMLLESLQITEANTVASMISPLSAACALAAILLRVSAPYRRAAFHYYPTPDWRARFLSFARRLENPDEVFDRAAAMGSLRKKPVATLQRLELLSRVSLEQRRDDAKLPKSERRPSSFGGELYGLNFEECAVLLGVGQNRQKNELTDAAGSPKSVAMRKQLPGLLERLRNATAAPGKKTELAESLNPKVPLESVSRWLSGSREPSGEVTLQLLYWVELQERQGK